MQGREVPHWASLSTNRRLNLSIETMYQISKYKLFHEEKNLLTTHKPNCSYHVRTSFVNVY